MNGGNDIKVCNVFGKSRFMYRWILTEDGKTIFVDDEDKVPDHFWIYSPKVVPHEDNTYAVSAKWCGKDISKLIDCLLYTSPSPRDRTRSRMPSSA